MKKFMKAIAFATVMCMLLSTVAFAEAVVDFATKKVTITVEGAQAGEQVALVITGAEATEFTAETILFVDQNATGEFEAVIEGVEAIDIYAGYASNTTANAVKVADDVSLVEEEEELQLSITLVNSEIVENITYVELDNKGSYSDAYEGTKGALVYFKLRVVNPEAGNISTMVWAFDVKKDGEETTVTKYVEADDTVKAAINAGILSGDIEIAAALDSTGYTVTAAKAAFVVDGARVDAE